MSETNYLLTEQAAEILHRNPRTLTNWRHQGVGPRYTKFGNRVLYRESDIYDFIEASAVEVEAKR